MKAILIIDIPNGCYDCPCYYEDRNQCQATLQNVGNADILKPSWCPLRLVPPKVQMDINEYYKGVADGWNDCINAMTGETECTTQKKDTSM